MHTLAGLGMDVRSKSAGCAAQGLGFDLLELHEGFNNLITSAATGMVLALLNPGLPVC